MLDFLIYTLEAGILFAIFSATYRYVYGGTSYYKWERGYLLISPVLSYLLPWLKVTYITEPKITRPCDKVVDVISHGAVDVVTISHEKVQPSGFSEFIHSQIFETFVILLLSVYLAGAIVKLVSFVNGLRKTLRLRKGSYSIIDGDVRVYESDVDAIAFSFFKNIFLGKKARGLAESDLQIIISHELKHIRGWHSIDTLVYGLFSVVQWMNPMARKSSMDASAICENIADSQVVEGNSLSEYSRLILSLGIKNRKYKPSKPKSSGKLLGRISQLFEADGDRIRQLRFISASPVMLLIVAAYIILGGLPRPVSCGLRMPLDGKFRISSGYFENQNFMSSQGDRFILSHRQVDFVAMADADIKAPIDARVTKADSTSLCLSRGAFDIIIGGCSAQYIGEGKDVQRGQSIGRAKREQLMYLRVLMYGQPVNPELVFEFQ